MRSTLNRYLLVEALKSSLLSFGVLLGVVLALFLAELLGDLARGRLAGSMLVELLALRLPEAAVLVGPLALLTGLLLALGRLAQDQELTIMRASGLPPVGILQALLSLALLWAVLLLLISGWLGPWAAERTETVLERAEQELLIAGIRPGQFERSEHGRMSFYVGSIESDTQLLERIFIHRAGPDGPEVISAASGQVWTEPDSGLRYLTLFDGRQVLHAAGESGFPLRQIDFQRNDFRLPEPDRGLRVDMAEKQQLPQLRHARSAAEFREWHWRLAPAVASLLLALLAAPVALGNPRGGRFVSVLLALLVYLAYSNGVHLGLLWLERGEAARGLGLWPLHAVVLVVAGTLWLRLRRRW